VDSVEQNDSRLLAKHSLVGCVSCSALARQYRQTNIDRQADTHVPFPPGGGGGGGGPPPGGGGGGGGGGGPPVVW